MSLRDRRDKCDKCDNRPPWGVVDRQARVLVTGGAERYFRAFKRHLVLRERYRSRTMRRPSMSVGLPTGGVEIGITFRVATFGSGSSSLRPPRGDGVND